MLVSLCLLSEDAGGKTGILFEKINKVIDIVVTDSAAYLMDGPICGKQHFFASSRRFLMRYLRGGIP